MASKENKGGILTNEQVEADNRVKGKAGEKGRSYIGFQDTGDSKVRELGSEVQKRDGLPQEEIDKEE
jgi:hypothetical protein